jgi:hypothetical protein
MGMSCSECGLSNPNVSGAQAQHLNGVHNQNTHGSTANGPSQAK